MTDLERCDREIAECEAELRAGNRDIYGVLLALLDWRTERRIILEREANGDIQHVDAI